jgi:hypothetical protein
MPNKPMNQLKSTSRLDLIKQIEKERNSALICYVTGDRDKFKTQIGEDIIPILFRHLELIGNKDNIDLFLYTRGGDMVAPLKIVKLIRNYCKKLSVLIPYRAHSAGTLIALGADEIVMHKLGELTPVDPTTGHPFNPRDPVNPQNVIPISVEDINSYLLLAKDRGKVNDDRMSEIYQNLTRHSYPDPKHLHPLALGNVYRAQRMIRILAEKLLSIHMDVEKESNGKLVEKIINEVTSDICIHNYPIYRDEARKMGLKITIPDEKLEKMLYSLYESYAEEMQLDRPFNPVEILGQEATRDLKYGAAYIESSVALDIFFFYVNISKISLPPALGQAAPPRINVNVSGFAWEKIK